MPPTAAAQERPQVYDAGHGRSFDEIPKGFDTPPPKTAAANTGENPVSPVGQGHANKVQTLVQEANHANGGGRLNFEIVWSPVAQALKSYGFQTPKP